MKTCTLFIVALLVSMNLSAAEPEREPASRFSTKQHWLPLTLGTGLLAWGAYELGDSASEGRRNLGILAGAAAVSAGGYWFYRSWNKKKRALALRPGSVQSAPALVLSYSY